ncbi:hypothetical protein [Ensifer sp. Root558]|uniref:hypothetical protein n=1 Tax=Ensifer sp. Root558 TaxID=1736558 RepID=UPI000713A91C|nr:hypothetical protein [Ensifer sp. Root558]KQZ49099.1 hypothetical protein ASD63_31195 [Ensifer sp. Root558]
MFRPSWTSVRYHFWVFSGKTVRLRIHETAGNTPVPAATDIIITVTADKQYVTILEDNHVGPSLQNQRGYRRLNGRAMPLRLARRFDAGWGQRPHLRKADR